MIKFFQDKNHLTTIEYGLITVAIIGTAAALGVEISNLFSGTESEIGDDL